jgi:electron transfer flavoprotein alpha subunit
MMSEFHGVWVIAELAAEGHLAETSQELMTAARRLADKLNQPLTGIILSGEQNTEQAQTQFGQFGANQVLSVKSAALSQYQVETYTAALAGIITERKPSIVLMAASSDTADYAPRLAIRTKGGLITNAIDLDLNSEGLVEVTRSCYAEFLLSRVTATIYPQLISVKKKAFPKPVANGNAVAVLETINLELESVSQRVKLVDVQQIGSKGAKKLEDADVIVSGGRGLKGPENFHLVEELAGALGGAVGASRAVVDAGWRPHAEQVGQTGKTVSPKVYVALGISGAIQHLVGMNTSQIIIAINRDENAPIFKSADFGIVGDAVEIVPELLRTIKEQNLVLHV